VTQYRHANLPSLLRRIRRSVSSTVLHAAVPTALKGAGRTAKHHLLGMEGRHGQGLWGHEHPRQGHICASSGLRAVRGRDPAWVWRLSPMRQPWMRQSRAPLCRTSVRKRGGHERQGSRGYIGSQGGAQDEVRRSDLGSHQVREDRCIASQGAPLVVGCRGQVDRRQQEDELCLVP